MADIEPGFVQEFGTSILEGMSTLAAATDMVGEEFEATSLDLVFAFKDELVPEELQGTWTITIQKGNIDG